MLSYKTEIRVRFSETDKMQYLHNVKYIEYFEVARTEMLRHYGIPYKDIEEGGYDMPVIETFVKYKSPAYYDDILIIESSVKELLTPRVRIDYKIFRQNSMKMIAEGYTVLAFLSRTTQRVSRPPKFFIEALHQYFENTDAN